MFSCLRQAMLHDTATGAPLQACRQVSRRRFAMPVGIIFDRLVTSAHRHLNPDLNIMT
jgi:hypothetical protein